MIIGGDKTPTLASGGGIKDETIPLEIVEVTSIGPGILVQYKMIK